MINSENHTGNDLAYSIKKFEAFAEGDPESTRLILVSFVQSSLQNLSLFEEYLEKNKDVLLSELAHKMLPMFRQLQNEKMIELLGKLELENIHQWTDSEQQTIGQLAIQTLEYLLKKIVADHKLNINK
ncbi:MAG TPA: hypothetical protein VKA27_06495 [Sunxiuqinia sp.]|nr:hypothetical protein [Sunxiuqinia sp.]